jgi:hypothetical protein
MPFNPIFPNPSIPPTPRDQHKGLPYSIKRIIERIQRIRLSDTIGFLFRLPVSAYIVLIGVIGGLFYAGYHLEQAGKTALLTPTTVQHERGEKGTKHERVEKGAKIEENSSLVKSDLQERMKSVERVLKEREAQIKERESVIISQHKEINELQSKLIAAQPKNIELAAHLGASEETISESPKERLSVRRPSPHNDLQMQLSTIIASKGYFILAPENVTGMGFYIDGHHYTSYKCLRKIAPTDLLGEPGRTNLFFAITDGDKVLSPVPFLHILPVEEGKHTMKLEPLSDAAENNPDETVVRLLARQVEFIDIDGIDVLSDDGGSRGKLKTFDLKGTVQRLSKVLESLIVDNDCLLEVLTTR